MPFVNIDGLKTYYESKGKGKPLILVHGAGGASTYWFNQLSALSEKLWVIAIDLPGHGKSEPLKRKPTIEQYADHTTDLVRNMKLQKVVLLGHSMGGLVAQQMALKNPELLEKLIIVGSGPKLPETPSAVSSRSGLSFDTKTLASSLFSQKTLRKMDAVSLMKQITQGMDPDFALRVLMLDFELAGTADFAKRLKDIKIPTLIVHGADDIIPILSAKYLHENINGSKLEVIRDAGHMVMMEKPDEFNNAILRFIEN